MILRLHSGCPATRFLPRKSFSRANRATWTWSACAPQAGERDCMPAAEGLALTPRRRVSQAVLIIDSPADCATLAALRSLSEHLPLKVRLEFPEEALPPVETVALLAGVLNTPTYGAGLRLAPDARIDNGLLHVVLLEDSGALNVLRLLPRLMASGELRTSRVRRWRVKAVRMYADRPCLFHGDGEILGPAPVEIEVVPNAIRVLAPSSKP